MRNRLLISAIFFFSLLFGTNVSGVISSNTTWTLANSPYLLTGNILVNAGVTLTIEAGVVINAESNTSILNKGTLIAIGTSENPIVFTSSSNNPGNYDWSGIDFSGETEDALYDEDGNYVSGTILKFVQVFYAGSSNAALRLINSSIFMDNITVKYSGNYAVKYEKSNYETVPISRITNSTLSYNEYGGVHCDCYQYNIAITVENSLIENNGGSGIDTGGGDSGGSQAHLLTIIMW